jgi:hypothetical protein
MPIALVWPNTVKKSNRQTVYRSGSDAQVHSGDVWRVVRERLCTVPATLDQLRLFLTVVDVGSFAGAERTLDRSDIGHLA